MKNLHALSLAVGYGMLAVTIFSPFDYWPIGLPVIALIYQLLSSGTEKRAFWCGLFFGLGFFGVGASWVYVSIHTYGSTPIPLAVLMTTLFVLVLSMLMTAPLFVVYRKLARLSNAYKNWHPLLFAAVWTLFEWMRSWLFTGFPWLIFGYSLTDVPVARGWAPVIGVFGLSFLYVLIGATIGSFFVHTRKAALQSALIVGLLLCGGWLLQLVQWTKPVVTKPITFSAIQGNIGQNLRWQPEQLRNIIQTYQYMSASEWGQDLIIWPENALPIVQNNIPDLLKQLDEQATKTNTTLILGMPWKKEQKYYNSVINLGASEHKVYYKQKLVPFGEYLPFEKLLRGMINFLNLPMSSFSAGSNQQSKFNLHGINAAALICYEVVYPDFVAQEAKNSHVLITVSNDTWFGRSIGPFQHFQMARMRALETGRYLIRATNDGISALIAPDASVVSTIEQYHPNILKGSFQPMEGITPFMRFGSWPLIFTCLTIIFVFLTKGFCLPLIQLRLPNENKEHSKQSMFRKGQ